MFFATPDDAVRAWWRLKTKIETIGCSGVVAVQCRVCSNCGGTDYSLYTSKNHAPINRCVRCRSEWIPEMQIIVKPSRISRPTEKNTFSKYMRVNERVWPDPSRGEIQIIRFCDLDAAIDELPNPQVKAYGLSIISEGDRYHIARRMTKIAPGTGPWTDERVRWAVQVCRRKLEDVLQRRGWWIAKDEVSACA